MKLYHYTSVTLVEGILSSSISYGRLERMNGRIEKPIWLTSDRYPEGHGLTTGNEKITESTITYIKKVQGQIENLTTKSKTQNKTQIRITIDIPETTPTLQLFSDYCEINENIMFAKKMGLSCYYDLRTISVDNFMRIYKKTKTKESTWWLSWMPLFPDVFSAIDFNDKGRFVPYSFELHGRKKLEDHGLVVTSAESLRSLAAIEKASHQFEQVKAIVFCEDPNAKPTVEIRGAGRSLTFLIENQSLVKGETTENIESLKLWIRNNSVELLDCWRHAVERYFSYYPEKRYLTHKSVNSTTNGMELLTDR